MVDHISDEQEPTAEFDQVCSDIRRRWEIGELPFNDAYQALQVKHQEAVSAGHLANQARAYNLMGYLQHYRGDLNASIRHYEEARALFERIGNLGRIAHMDLNNGENYRLKGDFTRARRLYRFAYEIAAQQGDRRTQAFASLNEGLVLVTVGQFKSALRALQEALDLMMSLPQDTQRLDAVLSEIRHAIATIYLAEGNYLQAWQEAKLALKHAEIEQERTAIALAYRLMGEIITQIQPEDASFSDPDDYFRLSLETFRGVNAEAEMARTMFAQAQSLAHRGKKTIAARKLQQVMIMFTQLGMVDDAAKAAEAQLSVL
ncbi:MAG: tetratricopeptide repeat protein [Anaerolineae bacterium]|jgi:tetratricopeptide (TPR) repeat protein|nr:tetratricopeptide repeat protein [Anaerolineae bacterium]